MLSLSYEFKLELATAQFAQVDWWLELCRRVYNYALTERKDWGDPWKSPINACSIRSE